MSGQSPPPDQSPLFGHHLATVQPIAVVGHHSADVRAIAADRPPFGCCRPLSNQLTALFGCCWPLLSQLMLSSHWLPLGRSVLATISRTSVQGPVFVSSICLSLPTSSVHRPTVCPAVHSSACPVFCPSG